MIYDGKRVFFTDMPLAMNNSDSFDDDVSDEEVLIKNNDNNIIFDATISSITLAKEYFMKICLKVPCTTSLI